MKRKNGIEKGTAILAILVFGILLVLFGVGIRQISASTLARQKESIETAIHRSVMQCYAVEGFYPPDVAYLQEHYGLVYDQKNFEIVYLSYGENLLPDIAVLQTNQREPVVGQIAK